MKTTAQHLLLTAALSGLGLGLWAWSDIPKTLWLSDHPFLQELEQQLERHQGHHRPEKLYLHLNKTFFEPGEDIWFAAYIRDARTYQMSRESDIVYVELLNPQGAILQNQALIGKGGKAAGDFKLDANLKGGMYKLRAYTKWQKNANEVFERDIQIQKPVLPNLNMRLEMGRKAYGPGDAVGAQLNLTGLDNQPLANYDFQYQLQLEGQSKATGAGKTDRNGNAVVEVKLPKDLKTNDGLLLVTLSYKGQTESISRSIPITLGNIDLAFFPEGGQLPAGVESGLAFKALNEFGKPADIAGFIADSKGKKVAEFATYHQGMGSLRFKAQAGEQYTAQITSPAGIAKKYSVPAAQTQAYTLNVESQTPKGLQLNIISPADEEVFVVGQCRGKVYYSNVVQAKKGSNLLLVDTDMFPIGICQFTLFDGKRTAQSERLAFVNPHGHLQVEVKTDKEKYLPREKVKATLHVRDAKDKPVSGDFSVAVIDDKLLTFADDKQGHLLSYMLLESDLRGKIEEPNFYFDDENDPARMFPNISRSKALDCLMQTQGWRRFEWKQVQTGVLPAMAHAGERAIVAGRITKYADGQAVQGATVKAGKLSATTDAQGNYVLDGLELYEAANLEVSAPGFASSGLSVTHYHGNNNAALRAIRTVSGTIIDENQKPIAGATISVPGSEISVKTDSKGAFKFECAEELSRINVEKDKFQTNQFAFASVGNVTNASFSLYSNDYLQREMNRMVLESRSSSIRQGALVPRANSAMNENFAMGGGGQPGNRAVLDDVKMAGRPDPAMPDVANVAVAKRENEKAPKDNAAADRREDEAPVEIAKEERVVEDKNMLGDRRSRDEMKKKSEEQRAMVSYYRARTFAGPEYKAGELPQTRSDFRRTVYWNPSVRVENGTAQFEFYNSDEISRFRISVEGFGQGGELGRREAHYFTQLPFEMLVKLPTAALMGDVLSIPLTLTNNTDVRIEGELTAGLPSGLRWKQTPDVKQVLNARESKTIYLQAEIQYEATAGGNLEVRFRSGAMSDAFVRPLTVESRGFPVQKVFVGKDLTHRFAPGIDQALPGSIRARLRLYPNTLDQVMQGIASMIRMPSGCFEQTSSSNYPNILALNYMRETGTSDPNIEKTALAYLDEGYKRLTGYESPGGGFDWWGRAPAHEALSAYGLMQFVDMKGVYDKVDNQLIDRTAKWLLSRRDGKGSWTKNPNCLHTWANSDITDAYIVYALASSGYASEVKKETDKSYNDAVKSEDPYMMGLMANALLAAKDARAVALLKELGKMQQKDGSFKGLKHSIVNSTGKGLDVETTALVALAMMQQNASVNSSINQAVAFLGQAKDFYGYGSTQGTVLTLKALLQHAKLSKRTAEDGSLALYLDGKKIGSLDYKAGQREIDDLEFGKLLSDKSGVLEARFEGTKSPIAFDIELTYNTRQPQNSAKCPFELTTALATGKAKMGETVRLTTTLKNKENKDQPVTMVVVGVPAGLSLQPWQLKELQEKKAFDYYEIYKGFVVFHFERINPNETRTVHLDLKADIPGSYEAPASSAFLYYNYEHKIWDKPSSLEILP